MKRWIRRGALILLGLGAAGGGLLFLTANVFFQPDRLVRKIEKRLNCRAHIGSVDLSLLSQPAQLILYDLQLGARDDHAEGGTPLGDRPALTEPQVSAKRISLSVSVLHLLVGKIHVHELVGSDVHARMVKPREGDHSLEVLFDKPDRERDGRIGDEGESAADRKNDEDDDDDDDSIDRLRLPATLQRARLENLQWDLELVEQRTRVSWHEAHIELTNVEISPSDLERKNHADFALRAKVAFNELDGDLHYGEMRLEGGGTVQPVDPKTRKIEPTVNFHVNVLPETYVETAPLVDAVVDKLGDLKRYGISLDEIKVDGRLQSQTILRGRYRDHLFALEEEAAFDFGDYQFSLAENSWFETEDSFHEFHSKLTAGPAITGRALGSVDRFVSRKLPFLPPDTFRRLIGDHFLENGQFTLKLTTKGEIGRPKVSFSEKLPEIDIDAVKESAEDLLDDLKSIFD